MEPATELVRQFISLPESSQNLFLDTVLDLFPAHRARQTRRRGIEPHPPVLSTATVAAANPEVRNEIVTSGCPQPIRSVRQNRRHSQVTAVDIEYVETVSGNHLIHSVAILSDTSLEPLLIRARLPDSVVLKNSLMLSPDIRQFVSPRTLADVNTIKATIRSLAEVSTLIMWDMDKDIAALQLPVSATVVDIAPMFRRTDGTTCSLRGSYYHFFNVDINSEGRDPRLSVKAILRLHNEILPILGEVDSASVCNTIPSNSRMNALMAAGGCKANRRRK